MKHFLSRMVRRGLRLQHCAWMLALIAASASIPVSAQSGRVVFILDGSNSMWGRIDGTEKIVVARSVLSDVLSDLPDDMQIGVAAYGHRREGACDDIETILPVGAHSQSEVEDAIRSVQPRGMTPITAALEHVAGELEDMPGRTQIVLVSDGKETCDRDPCAMVSTLREKGIDLTVHVVGFDVTGEESEQLQCIAEAGGGRYAAAGTAVELTAALAEIRATVVEDAAVAVPPPDPESAYWRLESDGTVYEGRLSFFFVLDGDPMIQLVNQDAVNVALAFEGEMSGVRTVTFAAFADAREPVCRRVGEADSFQISFEPSDTDWLTGSFSGMLGCPDYSLMPVSGSFHIRAPGERQ